VLISQLCLTERMPPVRRTPLGIASGTLIGHADPAC
jgi:hypothetical protein